MEKLCLERTWMESTLSLSLFASLPLSLPFLLTPLLPLFLFHYVCVFYNSPGIVIAFEVMPLSVQVNVPPKPWFEVCSNSSIPPELMMTETWSVMSSPFFWNVAVTALSSPFLQVNLTILGSLESGCERERESSSADIRDAVTNTITLCNICEAFILYNFHKIVVRLCTIFNCF